MHYRFTPLDDSTRFILPIWCYRAAGKGIYHDYLVSYYQAMPRSKACSMPIPHGFTFADASAHVSRPRSNHGVVSRWLSRTAYVGALRPFMT